MIDLKKAMTELEGLTKAVEPSAPRVAEALGELQAAAWSLRKAKPSKYATAPAPKLLVKEPVVDASTPMAKSAAAEASAHVTWTWQSFLEDR